MKPSTSSQTLGQAAAALANLPITETLSNALEAAASQLANAIRAELATPPGSPHDIPWRQTGALQASIAHTTDGLIAQIGSNDPVAALQEHGTATAPPLSRPRRHRHHPDRPRHRHRPHRPPLARTDVGSA